MRVAATLLTVLLVSGCARRDLVLTQVSAPAPAGSAEPFLAASGESVTLSWLEPVAGTDRFALRVARHRDGTWSAPRTVVERNDLFVNWADFPSVIEDRGGVLFAHWLQKSGDGKYAYDVRMASSKDAGVTWSAPFLLNRDGTQTEHGFVSLAALPASGGVAAAWLDGRKMSTGGDMTVRYAEVGADGALRNETELDARTCECCTTGMAIAASGPVVVYRDRSPGEIRDISVVRRTDGKWSSPRPLRDDGWKISGCPVNGPQIDAIGDRVAMAWFTGARGEERVFAAFSRDGGATFGNAIVADDGKPAGRVDIVMLDDQSALVVWLEQTATAAEIRARRIRADGEVENSTKIADTAMARASGFPRIVRSGDEVWMTWTDTRDASKQVRLARLALR